MCHCVLKIRASRLKPSSRLIKSDRDARLIPGAVLGVTVIPRVKVRRRVMAVPRARLVGRHVFSMLVLDG